ncbi:hypothetical protein HOD38_02885 [archaeon]|jgi:hypothetical protein|nr:hypothetical protein [archaeon]MBT4397187.1 hypothetical protein [archaeon]MBT4440567.1 hypothetical protein [archaeon]
MKYLALLIIVLLSFTMVVAEDCAITCLSEGYETGTCRAAEEGEDSFCESDETLTGAFDECTTGSYERCCCSGEVEIIENTEEIEEEETEEEETTEEIEEEEEEITTYTECKPLNIVIEPEDLPIILFFELLLVIIIVAIFVIFKNPKSDEF